MLKAWIITTTEYDLAPDEAHYWEWSRRLDYNYYSKGPIVAILIRLSTVLFGDTPFAVRLPGLICVLLFSLILYCYLRDKYSPGLALAAWLMLHSSLFFAVLGLVMTTDPPLILCWMIAIIFAEMGLRQQRARSWVLFGIFAGIATLSKYTALLLVPGLALTLVSNVELRPRLRSTGFVGAMLVFGILLLPTIIWNIEHGWVTLYHNLSHVTQIKTNAVPLRFTLELIGAQLGLVGPGVFAGSIFACFNVVRTWGRSNGYSQLLVSLSAPILLICLAVSLGKRVYPNWPIPFYIGSVLLLAQASMIDAQSLQLIRKWYGRALALNLMLTGIAFLPILGFTPAGLPASVLTTKKLVGWKDLGAIVEQQLDSHQGETELVVVTTSYETASSIAFYAPSHPEVFCAQVGERRMNQYDIWGGWEKLIGRNALIVVQSPSLDERLENAFERVTALPVSHPVYYSNDLIRSFHFFLGEGYRGGVEPKPSRF